MRLRAACAAAILLSGPAAWAGQTGPAPQAQPGSEQAPLPAPAWLPRDGADVVALDRISGRTLTLTLTVGQAGRFGSLTIALRACDVRPPDQAADSAAWLDITNAKPGAPQFHGWMLRSAPAVSSLQDPVYDVRLLGCR